MSFSATSTSSIYPYFTVSLTFRRFFRFFFCLILWSFICYSRLSATSIRWHRDDSIAPHFTSILIQVNNYHYPYYYYKWGWWNDGVSWSLSPATNSCIYVPPRVDNIATNPHSKGHATSAPDAERCPGGDAARQSYYPAIMENMENMENMEMSGQLSLETSSTSKTRGQTYNDPVDGCRRM